jgi:hypothetical protein
MTLAQDAEYYNTDRAAQLNLLNPEELAEMQRPSAPRLPEGKMPPSKADGGRKARHLKGNATEPKLPGV